MVGVGVIFRVGTVLACYEVTLNKLYLHVDSNTERVPKEGRGRSLEFMSSVEEKQDHEDPQNEERESHESPYHHFGVI